MKAREFISILVVSCVSCAASQTVWFKYARNPVLDVGPPGSWDSREVSEPRVLAIHDTLKMWFTGQSPRNFERIGYAWSTDGGLTWRKYASNPVISPTQSWERDWTFSPYVIYSGSQYMMWYTGADGFGQIGYASSTNGIRWKKSVKNPVVRSGPNPWDGMRIEWPCVLGPDSMGRFRMWYAGLNSGHTSAQIGYAEASDETTWIKSLDPVLTPGPGSWAQSYLRCARVLYDGATYRMWYNGGAHLYKDHQIGYATSTDGKQWTHHPAPVLRTGRPDPWDAASLFTPEVLFDGSQYHMWYEGNDGTKKRIGYAVSPKGARLEFSRLNDYVRPRADSIRVTLRVDNPAGLAFSVSLKKSLPHYMSPLDVIGTNLFSEAGAFDLFDDGMHGDSLKGDGIFSSTWAPTDELVYYLDIRMKDHRKTDFMLQNAAVFTSIGPIVLERVNFLSDSVANPGDTLLVKLTLRNRGASSTGAAIRASLSTPQTSLVTCSAVSPYYWDIPPRGQSTTDGYYRIIVNPLVSRESEATMHVSISTFDIPLWYDTFTLHVTLPWWRSPSAYAGGFALIGLLMFGLHRYNIHRINARNELRMKAFSAEKLREVDRMKSRFFANISHEFRTPLTLIQGPATQLLREGASVDIEANAAMIVKHTARLLRLVNQLLDLSKIEAGEIRLHVGKLDLVGLVKGIAAAFESLAKQKGIGFRVESQEDSIVGWFDKDAMEKIVSNLLSNAFKFTDPGGEITLEIREYQIDGQKSATLRVSDTGIGIGPDEIKRIFDRFYQVDHKHNHEQEGTGIGLALTKELVELHKGSIAVSSEPGRGSTFAVSLPLARENYSPDQIIENENALHPVAAAPATGESEPEEIGQSQAEEHPDLPLILIAEDNVDMQKYMRTSLGREFRIIEAMNGEEGLQKAADTIPDLVVSDVMMPGMDGFALCKRLKTDERTSHIPVILLTARADASDRIEGLETGADDYMTKPFDIRELLIRVKNLIDQRNRLRERFRKEGLPKPEEIAVTSADERFLARAMKIVETHMSDTSYSTDLFAEDMHLSRMQLHRKMKALTGRSPWEFVRLMRLERAALLLRKNAGSVAEIGYQIGYEEPTHFTEAFRNRYGVPPTEYARNHPDTSQVHRPALPPAVENPNVTHP